MRNEKFVNSKRPRIMFEKLLMDARNFFGAAKWGWSQATFHSQRVIEEVKEQQNKHPREIVCLGSEKKTGECPHLHIESLLTVSMMNYIISLELLLKGFLGLQGRFDDDSLKKIQKPSHNCRLVLQALRSAGKIEWVNALDEFYLESRMQDIELVPIWNWWDPPVEEYSVAPQIDSLQEFLRFVHEEKMHEERYSYERVAERNFRFKIDTSNLDKLVKFHELVDFFLCEQAKASGCWQDGLYVVIKVPDDAEILDWKLSLENQLKFDQTVHGSPKG